MTDKRKPLAAGDIVVGGVYRAKRFQRLAFGGSNDRVVLWISHAKGRVQYDSDTVGMGRLYPTVDLDAFLRWASRRVNEDGTDWNG